ncbi:RdRP-domain-containing protein [Eremomyces bilateralis CBS 781.70]|uniref:RNA-dependent RNA polymerase n=1 Tax=Eremomyces bilateralis CBS 781.70 TaxID=1392243 RepID=A0A6G1G398_9PEZI|nr:RdRP-domain-containing protein [Eremomyces bilateralis CBS 781.70]KAF1812534.1 RdRP-domain-containing protein [Eremomyces bilateralis CBS 781.70]
MPKLVNQFGADAVADALHHIYRTWPLPRPNSTERVTREKTTNMVIERMEEKAKETTSTRSRTVSRAKNEFMIHRARVTPSGIYLEGPFVEPSNRVLRKYAESTNHFLRVVFSDEDGGRIQVDPDYDDRSDIPGKFLSVMTKGVKIWGGSLYEFLGFSHSSLRAASCWFSAPFIHDRGLIHTPHIIAQLGDFSKLRSPAKCASRIGQAFSDTTKALTLPKSMYSRALDVKRNGYCFSDGCGTISPSLLSKVWKTYGLRQPVKPTILQIRFNGAKGVVSLDSSNPQETLTLRPSMWKFDAPHDWDIEICEGNFRPGPAFLNHQTIKILEDLGVPTASFLKLQSDAMAELQAVACTAWRASDLWLKRSFSEAGGVRTLLETCQVMGCKIGEDPTLRKLIEFAILFEVREMKYRGRIPVKEGSHVFGIMDEYGVLEEGQVYVVGVPVVVTRAPTLFPGDIQVVDAIDVPEDCPLRELSNCIVFPRKGARDIPSMLSGGDLDGDEFTVFWDSHLIPPTLEQPADFPRAIAHDLQQVTNQDMAEFFVRFMTSDKLGSIATKHKVLCDQKPEGSRHGYCEMLAKLHSDAVDYSKSGVPVEMRKIPRGLNKLASFRPDFMQPAPPIRLLSDVTLLEAIEIGVYEEMVVDLMLTFSVSPSTPLNKFEIVAGKILGRSDGQQGRVVRETTIQLRQAYDSECWWIRDWIISGEQGVEHPEYTLESLRRALACLWASTKEKGTLWQGVGKLESFWILSASVALQLLEKYKTGVFR